MEASKGNKVRIWKRVARWVAWIMAVPFLLLFSVMLLLYLPPVQSWLTPQVMCSVSEATGMDVRIGHIMLAPPFDLCLTEVVVCDTLQGDTLAAADELRVGVSLLPLLGGRVQGGLGVSGLQLHTGELMKTVEADGWIGSLRVENVEADLGQGRLDIGNLCLQDADVQVNLFPTDEPVDTVSSPIGWSFFLNEIEINRTGFVLAMPSRQIQVSAGWDSLQVVEVALNPDALTYGLVHFLLDGGNVSYHSGEVSSDTVGLDPSHIVAEGVNVVLDSLFYEGGTAGEAIVRQLAFRERSGLCIKQTKGCLQMDSTGVTLPMLQLLTSHSDIKTKGRLDWNALTKGGEGRMDFHAFMSIGKPDLLALLASSLSEDMKTFLPDKPVAFRLEAEGNVDSFLLNTLDLAMDSVVAIRAEGHGENLLDSAGRRGNVRLQLDAYDMSFLTLASDSLGRSAFVIPQGMNLEGEVSVDSQCYSANFDLYDGKEKGHLAAMGHYKIPVQEFALKVHADSLDLHRFLPEDSLSLLVAHAEVHGQGTDLYDAATALSASVGIDRLQYGSRNLDSLLLDASLRSHKAHVTVGSDNPSLKMQTDVHALLYRDSLQGYAEMDITEADLYALRLTDAPLTFSVRTRLSGETDWHNSHALRGRIYDMSLLTQQGDFAPKDLDIDAFSRPDSVWACIKAGDLDFSLKGGDNVPAILSGINHVARQVWTQLGQRSVNLAEIKGLLPNVSLSLKAGDDNPITNFLHYASGVEMEAVDISLSTSSYTGVYADAFVNKFRMDSLELDTIRLYVSQDTATIRLLTSVSNSQGKQKPAFRALLDGTVSESGGDALIHFFNGKNELGLELGARAMIENDGLRVSFFPERPTVGFRPFKLNEENYIVFSDSGRVTADVALVDEAGTGLRIYSSQGEETAQDLTIDISHLHIDEIQRMLPYVPELAGMLDAELHYMQDFNGNNTFSVALQAHDFMYEKQLLGTLGAEAVYLPVSSGKHFVSMQLLRNGEEIALAEADYKVQEKEGMIDGRLELQHFPLELANAFMAAELIRVDGWLQGGLEVKGNVSNPRFDGQVIFDSVTAHSPLYALDFKLAKNPLKAKNNCLYFEGFDIYAQGKNPFVLTGTVDFDNLSMPMADLRMQAVEYELLNAKENKNSLLYGKVFVSLFSTIKGNLAAPVVRGTMNVLGNTDVTYVLKESPLTVEDRLGSMVTFVNFSDTAAIGQMLPRQVSLGGLDLLLNVQIDPGAEFQADMGNDSYVEVQGGGNLSLQYTPQSDFSLTGRYVLNSGEMKYSLPIIPLKTFSIATGSYVEFMGDPTNPYLNITATERVRTAVTEENNSRYVNFDVGISISNSLDNMGLSFMLDAPEDVSVQNQLVAMSAEERGKLAVTMLVTGMYMGGQGNSSGGFSTNNALNSFLQSEISNIAGNALKTVDVSIGVEDKNSADGTSQGGTDYSFRFAKRFWNNRLSVIIGGRISTGDEVAAEKEGNSFIDDVSLEWRLDDTGTRYIKLFHTKNYESILEGEIIETGVGLVLRRKVNRLGELFIFKKQPVVMPGKARKEEEHDEE